MANPSAPSTRPAQVTVSIKNDVGLASVADQHVGPAGHAHLGLQYRCVTILVALGAYPMRRFGAACLFLQGVSERSASGVPKFIALLLSVPCFKASHLFFFQSEPSLFQADLSLQQRRALLLRRYCAIHGIVDLGLEFDGLDLKGRGIASIYCRWPP